VLQAVDLFSSPVEPGGTLTHGQSTVSAAGYSVPCRRRLIGHGIKDGIHLEITPNDSGRPSLDLTTGAVAGAGPGGVPGSIFDLALRACAEATPSVMAGVSASPALLVFWSRRFSRHQPHSLQRPLSTPSCCRRASAQCQARPRIAFIWILTGSRLTSPLRHLHTEAHSAT
jgi:hypothetical protein